MAIDSHLPRPKVEAVPNSPGPGCVWLEGSWEWQGRWVWQTGRWAAQPYPAAIWVKGKWSQAGGGLGKGQDQQRVWINSHWN